MGRPSVCGSSPAGASDGPPTMPILRGAGASLRARGVEELQELADRLAQIPERDRFGGLLSGHAFRATDFFRTERRENR